MKKALFSPWAIALLLCCAIALFAASVLLHAYDTSPVSSGNRAQPGSYSLSAIGHAGLYDTLRRLGRPVTRSVGQTLALTGETGTLIVAEPDLARMDNDASRRLTRAPRLLLVLPKWKGDADPAKPAWIAKATPVPLATARATASLAASRVDVFRQQWPDVWATNALGVTPTNPAPNPEGVIQLLSSPFVRPVVATDNGILVGEIRTSTGVTWILSDPDILANHGLPKGNNAPFMLALIDALRRINTTETNAPIVFDETVHGFRQAEESPVKLAFRFPFVIVTALACLTAVLAALAGARRFGKPAMPQPELDFGKAGLIANGARLLDYAGHHVVVLERYIRMTIRCVAQALHLPPALNDAERAARLDRAGEAMGVATSCASILPDTTTRYTLNQLFEAARAIHRWKGDMLHEPSRNRRHRHQNQG